MKLSKCGHGGFGRSDPSHRRSSNVALGAFCRQPKNFDDLYLHPCFFLIRHSAWPFCSRIFSFMQRHYAGKGCLPARVRYLDSRGKKEPNCPLTFSRLPHRKRSCRRE